MKFWAWLVLALTLDVASPDHIKCMNFYGLETERAGLVCDWAHPFSYYLDKLIYYIDVNTIRVPFSYELVKYHSLQLLDEFIYECKLRNLKVILDWHRTWVSHQGPTPEEGISREEFITTWLQMLERYPDTFGVGIFNEIQTDDYMYANSLHRDVITRIEQRFPGKYHYFCGCVKWGGDCSRIDLSDMKDTWNRTYIEVHKYIFSGKSNPTDWDISMPSTIPPEHWFVGEVGWKHDIVTEREWAEGFLAYLNARNISNLCAWTIAHSGDTEGWWKDDCETFQWEKAALLSSYWNNNMKRLRTFTSYFHRLLRLPSLHL
jgi:hypothetical protein